MGRDTSSYLRCRKSHSNSGIRTTAKPEGILSLRPSLVIGPEGLNPPTIVSQLQDADPSRAAAQSESCEDTKTSIRSLGKILNTETTASDLLQILNDLSFG